ncbi:hypothetical protein BV898_17891 [Hypsibius exemplaris]|uniref:Uncharacterized protein n=1 Tax=Hypsibius exemplaris TaxID=2072580 RepID=A0A9X6RMG8_HYPEX|nr:hypothetical protein BV898_17891 [Hypsibius exemplaris]
MFFDSVCVNHGPGTKLWYTVARTDLPKFCKYYAESPIKDCGHQFFHKSYAPSVQALLDAGIQCKYHAQGNQSDQDAAQRLQDWTVLLAERLQAKDRESCMVINANRLSGQIWTPVSEEFRQKFPETIQQVNKHA